MLPIVLVLLVASSALAAPSVSVSQYNINEIAPPSDNGRLVSSYIPEGIFELLDGAETTIYALTIQKILNDMANQNDPYIQATALSQILAIVGALGTGTAGDACEAAALVDSFASGRGSASATKTYLNRLASNLDVISQLAVNPNSLRYASGPRTGCAGGGRSYQFEAAWDAILDRASPYNIGLVNEEYCATKRLYNGFTARSNNVAAAITAASVPCVVEVVQQNLVPLSNFLKTVIAGGNASAAAAVAKAGLLAY